MATFAGTTPGSTRLQRWLTEQAFVHAAQQLVLHELILAARHAKEWLNRIEAAVVESVPQW